MEELTAQRALDYRAKYEATQAAINDLTRSVPWHRDLVLDECDLHRVREHWRGRFSEIVEVIETSASALREAMHREANVIAPCKIINSGGAHKTGARDAAIWLAAVEYAREHPDETVYFVSKDKDFGDGSSYPPPMDLDVGQLGDRFVHLPSLDDVVTKFATPTAIDGHLVIDALSTEEALAWARLEIAFRASEGDRIRVHIPALVPSSDEVGKSRLAYASNWYGFNDVKLNGVKDIRAHSVDGHVWCTATVRWTLAGAGGFPPQGNTMPAVTAFEAHVLLSPTKVDADITTLRDSGLQPATADEFEDRYVDAIAVVTSLVQGLGERQRFLSLDAPFMQVEPHLPDLRQALLWLRQAIEDQ